VSDRDLNAIFNLLKKRGVTQETWDPGNLKDTVTVLSQVLHYYDAGEADVQLFDDARYYGTNR
jgi:hypothetical protein